MDKHFISDLPPLHINSLPLFLAAYKINMQYRQVTKRGHSIKKMVHT